MSAAEWVTFDLCPVDGHGYWGTIRRGEPDPEPVAPEFTQEPLFEAGGDGQ